MKPARTTLALSRAIGIVAYAMLAASPSLSQNEEEKDALLQDALEKMWGLEFSRVAIRGVFQQSFTLNPDAPSDRLNFGRLFDDRANDWRLNQILITVEQ